MARNKVYLGQDKLSYSQAIKRITGWTDKQFETEKRLMRYRVSKFNKVTGSTLSPIEELYYRVKFEARRDYYRSKGQKVNDYNDLQSFFKNVKTGKYKEGQKISFIDKEGVKQYMTIEEYGREYVLKRYEGLGKNFSQAEDVLNQLRNGEISTQDANKQLSQIADDLRVLKNENPETWIELYGESHDSL